MVVNRMENTQVGGYSNEGSADFVSKPDSDDEFKWEEFFSTSVDITSTLLDIFDTMVAENVSHENASLPSQKAPTPAPKAGATSPPCDPGGMGPPSAKRPPLVGMNPHGHRPSRNYSKRSYSESAFQEKKRPLSSSSVSSSSSSSSSSLPRHDVKKSYLASIESLDDDEDEARGPEPPREEPASARPRWCDPQLSHTQRAVLEIVDTEETYVRDLRQIIQGYLKHIANSQDSRVSQQYLKELFSNVEDIYAFNSLFVNNLESCGLDPVAVARCFVSNSDGFEVYTQYCTNYPRTVSVLTELMGNGETAEIFKERQMALQHSLPLGSYLLKPVQRILKYHLLLQSLVKYSDKDSEGYCDVKNALSVMTGIAYHINDMKRKHEHAVRVQEIQSLLYGWEGEDLTTYGELVAEGAFRMYRAKALRHLFLFDKMLLIAKKKEEGILSFKTHIMCSNLMLIESIQGEPLCFHVIPFDNPRYQYTFQSRNVEQKREWCLQLKRVILENYNAVIPSHARQLVMELGQSKQEESVLEKSASRRQLSAPEYLEKRKQERRKSEINMNRTLKIKKGIKKGELVLNHKNNFSNGRRKSTSSSRSDIHNSWSGETDSKETWTKSQDDISQTRRWFSGRFTHSNKDSSNEQSNVPLNRSTRLRHSLPEPSLSQRVSQKERRFRPSWKAWNSVPEETTDTENEELDSKRDLESTVPYRERTYSELSEETLDVSGEYVTFFYAHAYATRDMHDESALNNNVTIPDNDVVHQSSDKSIPMGNFHSENKPFRQKDQDSESGSSVSSWKQMSALRRVQSFTGMAKAKVIALQHNISFKHGDKSKPKKLSCLPPSGSTADVKDVSPTTPAAWLQQQEEHLAEGGKKSGSLPRSFQLQSDSVEPINSGDGNVLRTRMRLDGQRSLYGEQRPFTIASDKPSQADFGDDLDYVVLDYSHCTSSGYPFMISKERFDQDTTTGCTNTPAISMENVHSIHPELKIYHQAASKYTTLKHIFSHMSSKIAGLKATFINTTHDSEQVSDVLDSELGKNGFKRSSSRSSIKSDGELNPRVFTAKLAHSVAKAYFSVMKHKKKHEFKVTEKMNESKLENLPNGTYKSESSLIGARMAQPMESEYSIPKHILPRLPKNFKDELRPDSLFSESSHATSSSDGDRNTMLESCHHRSLFSNNEEGEDTISETSDTSADSYYERTFDAIENALAQDIFRDSAIYSDPEDADFSTVELPKMDMMQCGNQNTCYENALSPSSSMLMCARPVNQAILDRLRILEENVKFQSEEALPATVGNPQPCIQKKLDLDKWGNLIFNKECEESETSSEHSASTVNTVMESVSKPVGSCLNVRNQPRVKGWVKHVVDKLQGEGRV